MNEEKKIIHYDALVIGGGIAEGEAALNLANTGFRVLLVEKERSLGGKMILLSKVFPTLDCSACITTPKISEIARHKNITIFTESEVTGMVKRSENDFVAQITKKPRYVHVDRKSTRLNSSHVRISYAVFCLKKKKKKQVKNQ